MHKLLLLAMIAALALPACGKETENKPAADKTGGDQTAADKTEPAADGPFGPFDPAAVQAKFQGAWVMPMTMGRKAAWNIAGNKVTVFDGKEEASFEFAVESPCTVQTIKKEAGGSSSTTYRVLWDGDTLHMGGDVGRRTGDTIVACISNGVWVYKAGKCQKWMRSFGDWSPKDVECSIAKDGDKEIFVAKGLSEHKVTITGDLLRTASAKPAEKKASWDEAKAALAAK